MNMLEQMARRLAMDALERVKPGTYTNVVDEIWLYRSEDGGKLTVSDYPHLGEVVPTLDSTTAVDTMVAMMAAEAGALVVVPEDTPMDPYLAQIAQLLVDSGDVPTDASDVADGAAIVGTVKQALAYLTDARGESLIKRERIVKLEGLNTSLQDEIERLNATIDGLQDANNSAFEKRSILQQEIGALTEQLSAAKRNAKRWEDEAANNQARYEGMEAALRIVLELAGVGK